MNCPPDRLYNAEHLWLLCTTENEALIGITEHAQDRLGQIVYVEYPDPGTEIRQGESFGTVESAKTVSDLISPASGRVTAVNDKLGEEPWLVNQDPYGGGWILRIRLADSAELQDLMSAEQYLHHIGDG